MLSAHQPFETFPALIKDAVRKAGGTAQVAGGEALAGADALGAG